MQPIGDDMIVGDELEHCSAEDLVAACRHLEDLEIFAGQRSRLHPGPGWATVLLILRRELAAARLEMHKQGLDEGR
jgi:hypothetical protein